jgi:hypothetical protein
MDLADGEGFEPSVPCGTHAFQACPIDRSGTHPKRAYEFGVDCQRLQPLCQRRHRRERRELIPLPALTTLSAFVTSHFSPAEPRARVALRSP